MRLLHTSDWHLGRTLHGVDLTPHHEAFLDHLVDVVRAESVDAVLVAGDVYDRAVPPVPSVQLLSDTLARLAHHTRVILTPGNHDSAVRLGFGARLWRPEVTVRARVAGVGEPVGLPGPDGHTAAYIYALPYLDPDAARGPLQAGARSHQSVMGAAMGRVRADLDARRAADPARVPAVVMAHAFVAGGEASDSERDIRVGGVDTVAAGTFAGADYVALGHLHGAQVVGRAEAGPGAEVRAAGGSAAGEGGSGSEGPGIATVRYCGSPLAFSFSEARHSKASLLVDVGPGGVTRVEPIAAPVPRRLVEVRGTLADLGSRAFEAERDGWARVVVTDPSRPDHLWEQVRELFPHVLVMTHEPAGRETVPGSREVTTATDPLDVLADFVAEAGGEPATEAELGVLRIVYEAALAGERSA